MLQHQDRVRPFEVTINKKRISKDSRTWSAVVSAVILLVVSMVFVLALSSSPKYSLAPKDSVESGSILKSELSEQKLQGGNLCQTGIHQSPIDLPESGTRLDELPFFGWSDDSSEANAEELFEGNTFQVKNIGAPSIRLDPEPDWFRGMKFTLKGLRFTTPSEHTVKSKHFDMEMQMIHTAIINGQERNMVVVQFFESAMTEPAFLSNLLRGAVALSGATPQPLVKLDFQADIAKAVLHNLPQTKNYMQYQGSMTTPPCEQGTTWVVLKTPLQVSALDLAVLRARQGANNRPTQPLNGRAVYDAHPYLLISLDR